MPPTFFEEQSEQSRIKAAIVAKYFPVWAQVVSKTVRESRHKKLAYMDLFCGPGRYKDGAKSVPIHVLETAIQNDFLRDHLVTIFNDADPENTSTLLEEVRHLSGVERLKFPPKIHTAEIGPSVIADFEQGKIVPTLSFIDPWGYKGISLRLINAVLKDWGCDVIFFFNYNRINMGLGKEAVKEHLDALFGRDRAEELRQRAETLPAHLRESLVIEELTNAIKGMGGEFVLPFCFKTNDGRRTSHYLIFISKHFRGYEIMKSIMAKASSIHDQGVASFHYCPADERMPTLFELTRPLSDLKDMLLKTYSGSSLTMRAIYEGHSVGHPYTDRNYKHALLELEQEGRIVATPQKRKKGTLADHVLITFA